MANMDLREFSVIELLRLSRAAVTELRARGIVRTANSPAGDYAEWLVARAVGSGGSGVRALVVLCGTV